MAKSKTENLSGNNLLIVMLLISLLVIGIAGVASKFLITSIIRNTKVVDAQMKANAQLDKNLTAAPDLVKAYGDLGKDKDILENALPTTEDFSGLIVLVENMANDSGVKLKSVAPAPNAATGDASADATGTAQATPKPYTFSVSVDGDYNAIRKFLADLELSARPMRVTGIQLNGSGSALSGELNLETYYQDKATLPFTKQVIK